TTTKNSFGEVFFTRNELECMIALNNYYYLYRVFDLNIESQTGSIKIFKGSESINSCFSFYTQSVKAKIRTDINISEMNVKDISL
ncbi:DUF3883 domain-containing protein, partial [Hymenobacter lapidiphilus]|uniref:DUF3883 domain-containing protein n=1 Tax=Hymenobacter lapidiphilus TaxID=2608003 RepID=UPI001C40A46D